METFIGQGFISGKICQNLIELFNNSVEKGAGTIWCGTVDGIINSKENEYHLTIFNSNISYLDKLKNDKSLIELYKNYKIMLIYIITIKIIHIK